MAVHEIIPSTNVKMEDIRDTLNANEGNVTNVLGTFFTDSAKINIFAARKPFEIANRETALSEDEFWQNGFGLRAYTFLGTSAEFISDMASKLADSEWVARRGMTYLKVSTAKRLSDFRGYYPKAKLYESVVAGDNWINYPPSTTGVIDLNELDGEAPDVPITTPNWTAAENYPVTRSATEANILDILASTFKNPHYDFSYLKSLRRGVLIAGAEFAFETISWKEIFSRVDSSGLTFEQNLTPGVVNNISVIDFLTSYTGTADKIGTAGRQTFYIISISEQQIIPDFIVTINTNVTPDYYYEVWLDINGVNGHNEALVFIDLYCPKLEVGVVGSNGVFDVITSVDLSGINNRSYFGTFGNGTPNMGYTGTLRARFTSRINNDPTSKIRKEAIADWT